MTFDARFIFSQNYVFSLNTLSIKIVSVFQVKQLLSIGREFLNIVCDKFNIKQFSTMDFEFLSEFLVCLQPIAETITVLEGDILYGHTLPALFTIQINFDEMRKNGLKYTLPLLNALENGFEKRYNEYLNPFNATAAPYFLAMASHPSYKLDCISMEKYKAKKIFDLLLNETQELKKKNDDRLAASGETNADVDLPGIIFCF